MLLSVPFPENLTRMLFDCYEMMICLVAYLFCLFYCSMELLESIVGGRAGTISHRVSASGSASPYHTRSKDIYSNRAASHHHTVPTNTLKYYIKTQRVSLSVSVAHTSVVCMCRMLLHTYCFCTSRFTHKCSPLYLY